MTARSWTPVAPGAVVRCPDCGHFVAELGPALGLEIRVHPGGKWAKPSDARGQALPCAGCGLRLDLRVLVGGSAAAA